MSRSQSEERVSLTVKAADRITEIFLIDSEFQRVDSGIGKLETELIPGIYKARFRAGQTQMDQFIEVEAGSGSKTFTGPPVEFATSAPLPQTSSNRQVHQDAAQERSQTVNLIKGIGSELYLFISSLSDEPSQPWLGVSLHDTKGNLIARAEEGECDTNKGFCALNIEVDPGTYRLRVEEEPGEIYEMFVVTVAGWQTQVFALEEDAWLPGIDASRAALTTASIFMAQEGKGFEPTNPVTRQTELIRLGLLNGRHLLSQDTAMLLLKEQELNPMLIILASHLLMQQNSTDYPLVNNILEDLKEPLLFHPDIQALLLHKKTIDSKFILGFPSPPMLSSSWQCIVQATNLGRAVMPQCSLSEQVAGGILNTSLWLIHRLPGQDKQFCY
ncbi:MAG: hypothetical protein D3923_10070 [Candidatus Electrothrix sp. AR3]|nr:hypothetical protein [Candidatus Electrothrix sp. AR3]